MNKVERRRQAPMARCHTPIRTPRLRCRPVGRFYVALFGLVLCAVPTAGALAQPAGLAVEVLPGGTEALDLEVRSLPLPEVLRKLSEATHQSLRCDPKLNERKVTLIGRGRPGEALCQALARAVSARWRREGEGFLLEPADPAQLASAQETAVALRAALLAPGVTASLVDTFRMERGLPGIFTPEQVAVLQSGALPIARLSPQQRDWIAGLLRSRIAANLAQVPFQLARVIGVGETATVQLERQGDKDVLVTRAPELTVTQPTTAP